MATEQAKRCGTCAWYDEDNASCTWDGVLPWAFSQPYLLRQTDGTDCPTWAAKDEQSPQEESPSGYWAAAERAKLQVDSWPQWKKDAAKAAFCRPEDTQP